ncbi:hypothetical protein ABZ312_09835 [Streptomyces sp. NPDC006207]
MDDETRARAISLLFAAAETSAEINALARVARRAGFLWRCPDCKDDQYPTRDTCRCGAARPAGSAEE